jgi:hypothetical protein
VLEKEGKRYKQWLKETKTQRDKNTERKLKLTFGMVPWNHIHLETFSYDWVKEREIQKRLIEEEGINGWPMVRGREREKEREKER